MKSINKLIRLLPFSFCFVVILLALLVTFSCENEQKGSSNKTEQPSIEKKRNSSFKHLSPEKTGVYFNNKITHNLTTKFNLFDYDYFYNGAGVAVGDFNNDGLNDIFFCGNQVDNKLFVNKGDFKFQDITSSANINIGKQWANGVTLADINGDGYLDIYISQGGPLDENLRKNILLINNKDLTFTESGELYGLADTGISTQSVFFDYDKDGDLDCVVMNENELYGLDPNSFYDALKNTDLLSKNTSKLYQNTDGKFTNITEQAGLLNATFGLGINVSDINNDGWLDIYIANDYYVPDALYLNNKNGTFSDEIKNTTNQVSFYGMGLDVADLNNDNLNDIIVLDMASSDHIRSKTLMASMNVPQFELLTNELELQHQYMFNSVQLNLGKNKFHNIAALTGMSKTDWSWAALVMDANHDELEDIYVTNGYRRYALDNDSRRKVRQAQQYYKGNVPFEVKKDIYDNLPSEKLANVFYQNNGDLVFENVASYSELNIPSFSNGASYADLDNDGDLDLVVNNMDDEAFLFKNEAVENSSGNFLKVITQGELSEDFAKVIISYDGKTKTKEALRVRGYLSAVDKTVHFGVGYTNNIDEVTVRWPSGKEAKFTDVKANTTLTAVESDASDFTANNTIENYQFFQMSNNLNFEHRENLFNDFQKEVLLPYKQSTQGPLLSRGDVNGDGKDDLFIGGSFGQASVIYIQTESGFELAEIPVFEEDRYYEDMEAAFIDIDSDGDQDLYVVSGGSEFNARSPQLIDRVYFNDGKGNFSKESYAELTNNAISGKTVSRIDFDKDGDFDLIVGNRIAPQKYPIHEPSIIYLNDNGNFKNVTGTIAPEFEDFGMVNKVIVTDFNNDGLDDFIAVGEWTHIGMFQNNNGIFEDVSSKFALDKEKGWWFSVVETDINNDGFKDYVVGNIGKNIKLKATPEKPLKIYAADFDNNSTHDVVLSYKYNDTFVPLRGKECSTQQMPFIAEKVPTFQQFANSSLQDIYGDTILTAYQREATQFNSVILLNDGTNNYTLKPLPKLAQSLPILDLAEFDYNNDGFMDLVAVGNIYNTEVETPRLDNAFAIVLQSNQNDGYNIIMPKDSGLYISGNAKSVEVFKYNNETQILVGCNNGPVETFQSTATQ